MTLEKEYNKYHKEWLELNKQINIFQNKIDELTKQRDNITKSILTLAEKNEISTLMKQK